jgi:hypothetical protein
MVSYTVHIQSLSNNVLNDESIIRYMESTYVIYTKERIAFSYIRKGIRSSSVWQSDTSVH